MGYENKESITSEDMENAMQIIKKYCESFPTCVGCDRCIDKLGCYFRYHTPREYNV